jgi:acetyl esterase
MAELHPVIKELLNTKFNPNIKQPIDIPYFRYLFNDLTRIVSFSESSSLPPFEFTLTPDDLPAFKCRLYHNGKSGPKAILVYFHGGNWIAGDLQTCDAICHTFADESDYVVISVDYALAPEYHFPVALYQGLAVIDWINEKGSIYGLDPGKIVIGGDNAGGNIAAGLVHLIWEARGIKLFGQLLVCPALHYRFDTPSYRIYDKGYLISKEFMLQAWQAYLGNSDEAYSEFASPLLTGRVTHVPQTLIYTAEHDPLRDEAELYAARLNRQGISVCMKRFTGVTHHFWQMDAVLDTAHNAHQEAAFWLSHINQV